MDSRISASRNHDIASLAWQVLLVLPVLRKRMIGLDDVKQTHGLPFSQIQVLVYLEEHGAVTVSQISKRFDIAKSNITPLIDRLIQSGFVERTRSRQDRRVVNIGLMPAGRQQLNEIRASVSKNMEDWFRGAIGEAESERFCDALDLVCATVLKNEELNG